MERIFLGDVRLGYFELTHFAQLLINQFKGLSDYRISSELHDEEGELSTTHEFISSTSNDSSIKNRLFQRSEELSKADIR